MGNVYNLCENKQARDNKIEELVQRLDNVNDGVRSGSTRRSGMRSAGATSKNINLQPGSAFTAYE